MTSGPRPHLLLSLTPKIALFQTLPSSAQFEPMRTPQIDSYFMGVRNTVNHRRSIQRMHTHRTHTRHPPPPTTPHPVNTPAVTPRYVRAQCDTCVMPVQTLLRARACYHLPRPLWPPRRVCWWEGRDWCWTDAVRPIWPSCCFPQNASDTSTRHLVFTG